MTDELTARCRRCGAAFVQVTADQVGYPSYECPKAPGKWCDPECTITVENPAMRDRFNEILGEG